MAVAAGTQAVYHASVPLHHVRLMALKITLTAWAAQEFDPPPAERTLRLWVKEGRIVPAPIKVGRMYYCQPDAKHIAEASRRPSLVQRLQSA